MTDDQLREKLGLIKNGRGSDSTTIDDGRVTICVHDQNIPVMAELAWQALRDANEPERYFVFGIKPTRIAHDGRSRVHLQPLTEDAMWHEVRRCANWYQLDKRAGDDSMRKDADPPRNLIKDMLASPTFPFPLLKRVTKVPVFAKDGTIADEEGYHSASATYLAGNDLNVAAIPDKPSRDQVAAAKAWILDELFVDFPFTGPAERANAVALLLLPFMRSVIDGPTPLHVISKPTQGTGAGLLADVIAIVTTGQHAPVMAAPANDQEWNKTITALLADSPTFVMIDNLRGTLSSPSLSAALTGETWTGRKLGRSEMIRDLPNEACWIATGNNPTFDADLSRRIIRIHLDAQRDKPWLPREGAYRHEHLVDWTLEHRGDLVAACLTLCRAWFAAGCPDGIARLGTYDRWASVMSGVLDIAGIPGFLANLTDFYESSNDESEVYRNLLHRWWSEFGGDDKTAAQLLPLAVEIGVDLGSGNEQHQRKALGMQLNQIKGSVYELDGNGLGVPAVRVMRNGTNRKNVALWRLDASQRAGTAGTEGTEGTKFVPRIEEIDEFNIRMAA